MDYFAISTEWFGHLAYACLAASYFMTNIFWLRVLAVVSMLLELAYFNFAGGDLTTGMSWNAVFVAINLYQLFWLLRDRLTLRLPEHDGPVLRSALTGLDDAQIARLLKAAHWKTVSKGKTLTTQHKPVDELYFICAGRLSVQVDGTVMAHLEKGSFVGEIAYLTGNPATATVVVDEPCRILAFSRTRLAKVVASDTHISGLIYQMLGRDLAMKMGQANRRHMAGAESLAQV